jgi:hypothetical protein
MLSKFIRLVTNAFSVEAMGDGCDIILSTIILSTLVICVSYPCFSMDFVFYPFAVDFQYHSFTCCSFALQLATNYFIGSKGHLALLQLLYSGEI